MLTKLKTRDKQWYAIWSAVLDLLRDMDAYLVPYRIRSIIANQISKPIEDQIDREIWAGIEAQLKEINAN